MSSNIITNKPKQKNNTRKKRKLIQTPSDKQFVFMNKDQVKYKCTLFRGTCELCNQKSNMGYEYCNDHLLSHRNLVIKNSTIEGAGMGLFASNGTDINIDHRKNAIIFKGPKESKYSPKSKHGDEIIAYHGDIITWDKMYEIYGEGIIGPYCAESNGSIIDAACKRGVGSFCNHKPRTHANATLYGNPLKIAATKNIRNGDEIFITYNQKNADGTRYDVEDLYKKGFRYKTESVE
jgi:hypothetical protein